MRKTEPRDFWEVLVRRFAREEKNWVYTRQYNTGCCELRFAYLFVTEMRCHLRMDRFEVRPGCAIILLDSFEPGIGQSRMRMKHNCSSVL